MHLMFAMLPEAQFMRRILVATRDATKRQVPDGLELALEVGRML